MTVFLHFLIKFPAWARAVHMLTFVWVGFHSIGLVVLLPFFAAPLDKLNKTKQLRLTKMLFELASHFVPRLWYSKMAHQL